MNKRRFLICSCVLSVLMIFVISLLFHNVSTVTVNTSSSVKPTIVIDAGHGGEDGGAVSDSGLVEKDVNLEIALTLQQFFIQGGFDVVMIRTTDTAIYDDSATTLREKKVSDIHNRSDICNSDNNNILISIHQNKFEQSQYSGTQVFYSVNDSVSSELAEYIRSAVKGLLQNSNERQCKPSTSSIYILDKATVPAVLVECGFLSNPAEEKLLSKEQYKNSMAFSIYTGFLEFYYQYY